FPSLHATPLDLSTRMKSTGSTPAGESFGRRLPLNKTLVVAQVSFSLVLLIAAGLFVHSLSKLGRVSLGYNQENLLLFRVNAAAGGYKGAAVTRKKSDEHTHELQSAFDLVRRLLLATQQVSPEHLAEVPSPR